MLEILLFFQVGNYEPSISDKVFTSFEECTMFVNETARNDVVNSDYGFSFLTSDGMIVVGQCIERSEYEERFVK